MQLTQLLHHYSNEATLFMYAHVALLIWAVACVVSARLRVEKHLLMLRKRIRPRRERRTSSWNHLLFMYWKEPHPAFTEVEPVYNDLFEDATGVLNRLTNLLLLTGVAGTLYGLYGGTGAGATSATWEALRTGAFNAFSVTIVAVALAAVVTLLGRYLDRFLAQRKAELALLWNDQVGGSSGDLAAALAKVMSEFSPAVEGLQQELAIAREEGHHLQNVVRQCGEIGAALGSVSHAVGQLLQGLTSAQAQYSRGLDETRRNIQADHEDYRTTLKEQNETLQQTLAAHRDEILNLQKKTLVAFAEVESRTSELFGRLGNDVFNLGKRLDGMAPQLTRAMADLGPHLESSQRAVIETAEATQRALEAVRSSAQGMSFGGGGGFQPPPEPQPRPWGTTVVVMFVISLITSTATAFFMGR
jgi:hypothetical protein